MIDGVDFHTATKCSENYTMGSDASVEPLTPGEERRETADGIEIHMVTICSEKYSVGSDASVKPLTPAEEQGETADGVEVHMATNCLGQYFRQANGINEIYPQRSGGRLRMASNLTWPIK